MKRREFIISGGAAILLLQSRLFLFGRTPGKPRPNIVFIDLDSLGHPNNRALFRSAEGNIPGLKRLTETGSSVKKSLSYHPGAPGLSRSLKDSSYRTYHVGNWDMPGKDVREHFTVLQEGGWCGELSDQDVTSGAKSFLRNYSESQPFFLSLSYFKPGECCHPNQESPLPNEVEYLHSVERIDLEIEILLQEVERSQWSKNTLILYSLEHGEGLDGLHTEQEES